MMQQWLGKRGSNCELTHECCWCVLCLRVRRLGRHPNMLICDEWMSKVSRNSHFFRRRRRLWEEDLPPAAASLSALCLSSTACASSRRLFASAFLGARRTASFKRVAAAAASPSDSNADPNPTKHGTEDMSR